ncbi:MAG: hypothetical protein KIT73_11505 [Burkholderiales bacterium]|nr:hypothetical protein [Burkholderiales bacterium]
MEAVTATPRVGTAARARNLGTLLAWHRRIGIVACVGVLMWGVSGLSHPILTRIQPKPVTPMPPAVAVDLGTLRSVDSILSAAGIDSIRHLRLVTEFGGPMYQVRVADSSELRYFDALTGQEQRQADRESAVLLARHFTGDRASTVRSATLVTAFDDEYPYVNRLLPVWRVAFDRPDGLLAYVDTGSSRLGTLVDDRKTVFQTAFQVLHNGRWLRGSEGLRVAVMTVFLAAALSTTGLGLWLYGVRWSTLRRAPGRGLRRVHRNVAVAVSVTTLLFAVSGLLHLWVLSGTRGALPQIVPQAWAVTALASLGSPTGQASGWTLVDIGGKPVARLQLPTVMPTAEHGAHAGHGAPSGAATVRYVAAGNVELPDGDRDRALALARHFSGIIDRPPLSIDPVTKFEDEYGFVNKRLPVWRVVFEGPENDRWYVETRSGALAAHVTDGAALEGRVFAAVHKWNLLAGFGPNVRDIVAATFAFGNVAVALMGLALFLRRRSVGARR